VGDAPAPPFERLDFLYTPSTDVPRDLRYFTEVLGGRAIFAIDAMGTRVAAVELTEGPPLVLLTDHVEGERPILVYRVGSLATALEDLTGRGWEREARSRSHTGHAARSEPRAATASRCTNSSGPS
jgi:hypothetical protein